jgi:hypothetical protein
VFRGSNAVCCEDGWPSSGLLRRVARFKVSAVSDKLLSPSGRNVGTFLLAFYETMRPNNPKYSHLQENIFLIRCSLYKVFFFGPFSLHL